MPTEHEITLDQGVELTTRFRNNQPSGTKRAFLIDKEDLTELLAQDDAAGIRVYIGQKTNGELALVVVATDSEESDIQSIVMDRFHPCPDKCDSNSPL
jgi:hypothetical protein